MICSSPGCGSMPSPITMPSPPALKNAWCTPEMLLIAPATPTVSSGRPHCLPLIDAPADIVRSISVLFHGSTSPSAQPARAKTPKVSLTCCCKFTLRPGPAGVAANGIDVGWGACYRRERIRIGEMSSPAAAQITGDLDRTRLPPKLVAPLDFADHLELIECWIKIAASRTVSAGRSNRQIEQAATHGPVALIPLGGRTVGETPGVAGIVESTPSTRSRSCRSKSCRRSSRGSPRRSSACFRAAGAALSLSGCGRNGSLEIPLGLAGYPPAPAALSAPPPGPVAPAPADASAAPLTSQETIAKTGFDPHGNPAATPGQKKPFLLDPLLQ
jgi:hypothetical protein